jgi:hypothetical protein
MLERQFFLPDGYPDELLFSIVSRLARSLGYTRLEELSPTPRSHIDSVSPFGLTGLTWIVSPLRYDDPNAVIRHYALTHSPLRYLLPFESTGGSELVVSSLRLGTHCYAGAFTAKWFRQLVDEIDYRPRLRWCPECADADLHTVGERYWHLSHQLPCSLVCAQHGVWLESEPHTDTLAPRIPDPKLSFARRPLRRAPAPGVRALAEADRAMLELAPFGFFGHQMRCAIERALGVERARLDVRVDALRNVVRMFDGDEWRPVRESFPFWPVKLLSERDLVDLLSTSYNSRLTTAFHVFMSALLRIDLAQMLANAVDASSGTLVESICGGRFCQRYSVRWADAARRRAGGLGQRARLECVDCGFAAEWSTASHDVAVREAGAHARAVVRELLDDGIREAQDVARIVGVPYELALALIADAKEDRAPEALPAVATPGDYKLNLEIFLSPRRLAQLAARKITLH